MFSKNQLEKWDRAKQQIACFKHTSGAVQELRCDTCGQVRDLSCFSKGSRRATGGRHDCRDCIAWTEADQVGVRPLPMPGGQRDESELGLAKAAREAQLEDGLAGAFNDLRLGYDTTTETATETRSEYSDDETVNDVGGNLNSGLTTRNLNMFLKATQSVATTSSANTTRYHPSSAPTDNSSAVGPAHRNQRRVQYQAIGPNGAVQMRTQSTINPTDTTSVTTATQQTDTTRGGWAKPSTRKTNPDPPSYILREDLGVSTEQAYDSDLSDDFP